MKAIAHGLLAAIGLASIVAAAAPRDDVFSVGVLRRDGGLIPIGTFTGRTWQVSWPADSYDRLEIPITLDAVPHEWWGRAGRLDQWQIWADGAPRGTLHLVGPRVVTAMCSGRLALATDFKAPDVPPPQVQPHPKIGVAVSPPVASVARIEILEPKAPEWEKIAEPLKREFDEEEDVLAAQWTRAGDPHPIQRKERLATPLMTEAMYATDDGADRVYYVEASRKYDHSRDDRSICAVAFGNIFFRRESGKVRPLGGEVRVVPCDRRGLVYMLPLGAMRVDGKLFWLTQYSGWDFEQYNIIQFKRWAVAVAASTFGGRCENRPSE